MQLVVVLPAVQEDTEADCPARRTRGPDARGCPAEQRALPSLQQEPGSRYHERMQCTRN